MTTRALTTVDLLAIQARAASTIGEHEQPLGSNNTRFGKNMGTNYLAWCMAWLQTVHEEILGRAVLSAYILRSSSCYMVERDAQRRGIWHDARTTKAKKGDWLLMLWNGQSIVHHTALVSADSNTIGRAAYTAGNESDRVRTGVRTSQVHGYVRLPFGLYVPPHADPAKPTSIDLGRPPSLKWTQKPDGAHNDPKAIEYVQKALNFILPQWGHSFHVPVTGRWTPELTLGLAAYKHYANQKQWQWFHRPGAHEAMPERMYLDENNGEVGPRALGYLRLGALAPNPH